MSDGCCSHVCEAYIELLCLLLGCAMCLSRRCLGLIRCVLSGHGLRDAVAWLAELFGCVPSELWSARSSDVGLAAFDLGDVRPARCLEVRRPRLVCRAVARSSVLALVDGFFDDVLSNPS